MGVGCGIAEGGEVACVGEGAGLGPGGGVGAGGGVDGGLEREGTVGEDVVEEGLVCAVWGGEVGGCGMQLGGWGE